MKRFVFAFLLICALTCASFAQPATIAPNENLVVENIPAVPQSIAETANRYTEYRTATVFDWHPTKREMLIGTRFGDTVQVHRVAMPMGARTQLTFYPDRISSARYKPHTGDYFLF